MDQDEKVVFQEPFDDGGDVLDCLATYKRNYLGARTNYNFSPVTSQQNKTKHNKQSKKTNSQPYTHTATPSPWPHSTHGRACAARTRQCTDRRRPRGGASDMTGCVFFCDVGILGRWFLNDLKHQRLGSRPLPGRRLEGKQLEKSLGFI